MPKIYAFSHTHQKNTQAFFEQKTGLQLKPARYRRPMRLLAAALAVLLCLSAAAPALAANVPGFYEMLYRISPGAAQFFTPVRQLDEVNGIRMEVVSAYVRGDTAEIYITMQDLTGDRVDASIDLYDSYSINRPFGGVGHCEQVAYDESTKTATFLITLTKWEGQDITGDKITFSLQKFLSNKQYYENISIPFDAAEAETNPPLQSVEVNGGSYMYEPVDFKNAFTALVPSAAKQWFPVEGIDLTAVGYVEGKLHIQTAVADYRSNDNHGFFYFQDGTGNEIPCEMSFSFSQETESGRIDYDEYVFDIPQGSLADYSLYGDFVTADALTEGGWSVTFPLEQPEL